MQMHQALLLTCLAHRGIAQLTPGFQFLGFGYDILRGNPRDTNGFGDTGFQTNIFTFTTNDGQKTPDGKWSVPDKTTLQPMTACTSRQTQTIINSAYAYKRTVDTGIDIAGDFFGVEFDFSIDTKHIRTTTEKKQSIFGQQDAVCSAYKLTMHTYDHPDVDPNFRAGVNSLPSVYNEEPYMRFLKTFGTHVVDSMILGGRWGWQMEFKLDDYRMLMDDSINVGLYLGYAGQVKAGFRLNHSEDTQLVTRVTNAISKNYSFSVGGEFRTNLGDWQESVRNNPMPIVLSLMRLSDLFTSSYLPNVANLTVRKANLEHALSTYCPYLSKSEDPTVSCTPPRPIPLPTPPPDVKDDIHRVCVKNSGGFALNFDMYIPGTSHLATSDTYPNPQDRCLDGMMINAEGQDTLRCRVHIIAGTTTDCEGQGYKYNPLSKLQANYDCTGTTMSNSCRFVGLSQVGDVLGVTKKEPEVVRTPAIIV